jgi:predicted nucleotidyltransferase
MDNIKEIKDKISDNQYYFLKELQDYIGENLLFFGSIKRCDFMKENSDIDIAIISDNPHSTLKKIQAFLHLADTKIRNIVQKIPNKKEVIYGYKTNYDNEENGLSLEIVLYNEKYREDILTHIHKINNFPFYILIPLIILKVFYYKLHIISKETLGFFKSIIMKNYLHQELDENLIALKF